MKKIQIALLLMLLVLFAGCSSDEKVVNIGLLMVPNDAILAKEMGLFEEKFGDLGYEVEYYIFDSGTAANTAIFANSIDFASMGNINGLVALGSNLNAELIWIHETLGAVEALAVRTEENIETVDDLAREYRDTGEKMVIATPFSSTSHYILLNVLQEAGIEDEVKLVSMTTSQIATSWQNKTIDAAYTWQPSLGTLIENGGEVLVSSEDMIAKGYMTANIELTRKTFAQENPELVQAYIECMDEAYAYFISNRTDAISKLAEALDQTVADIEVQVNGSIWTSLAEMRSETFITDYVDTMYAQTIFMLEQDLVGRTISRDEVAAFIKNSYALEVNNSDFVRQNEKAN